MSEPVEYVIRTVWIGVGATVVMDLWAVLRLRLFGIPSLDYAFVGRWLGHLRWGRFFHDPIAKSPRVPGERVIGWTAHYLIGIAFAAVLVAGWGLAWARQPTLGPALIVGIGSVVAPFCVMQPAMGAGFAASRTPRPGMARFQSLVTHGIFGVGLYLAAVVARMAGV
ncbi:DUF2938 domain-containing protein [Acidovorax cavernicola]|uniref:DUF2938 domain-containing protein n=1 Tax=Acidovorax cavernicola TaxID=1675792 RepID=A0A9X8D4P8_9BURK|nr:DUF2938 domain-containing protein [Acidovorax cavernicola]RIX79564.1 DUF2938 domain-containing protein [Acidovorax cavernicola]